MLGRGGVMQKREGVAGVKGGVVLDRTFIKTRRISLAFNEFLLYDLFSVCFVSVLIFL